VQAVRNAAAMPVEPVQAVRPASDLRFRDGVEATAWRPQPDRPAETPFFDREAETAVRHRILTQILGDQSVPFLAQQLGQGMRLISPTLAPVAEVAAYAAAQQRADRAAEDQQALLDLRA